MGVSSVGSLDKLPRQSLPVLRGPADRPSQQYMYIQQVSVRNERVHRTEQQGRASHPGGSALRSRACGGLCCPPDSQRPDRTTRRRPAAVGATREAELAAPCGRLPVATDVPPGAAPPKPSSQVIEV